MSHFHLCEDNCYQNCKVIVTKNLRWNLYLAMEEKWPNYRGMAARYWMSHEYHLAFYFWWLSKICGNKLSCIFLFSGIYFLDQKNRSCQDSWGFLFFLCFPEEFFTGTWFWRWSQEFLFFAAVTGIFCRNSCGTEIPVFTPDSSGFLRIPPDSSGFLRIPVPAKTVWLWPATKEGSLLSKIWTKRDLF